MSWHMLVVAQKAVFIPPGGSDIAAEIDALSIGGVGIKAIDHALLAQKLASAGS